MEKIKLSINPTYYCNFRCKFCYLSEDQLSDPKKLLLDTLLHRLNEIGSFRLIESVDIYGGEVSLLSEDYFRDLKRIIRAYYSDPISVITNLKVVRPYLLTDDIDLSVSWDYFAREHYQVVYENMKSLEIPFHILTLASQEIVNMSDSELDQYVISLNQLQNLKTIEIKPYSFNKYNKQSVTFKEYEVFIKRLITKKNSFKFDFINELKIKESLQKKYSSWSDDHLYIDPAGDYRVLEFTDDGEEYFEKVNTFLDYEKWAAKEKLQVKNNSYCGSCKYLGHCLSEHLQMVKSTENSCNGFYNLLDWYENERL
ncbi:MAG: radical SAM protein [Pseudobdellovibrio sp.]